jgi:hypothetical protein
MVANFLPKPDDDVTAALVKVDVAVLIFIAQVAGAVLAISFASLHLILFNLSHSPYLLHSLCFFTITNFLIIGFVIPPCFQ